MKLDQLNSQAFENSASGGASGTLKEAERELKKAQKALKAVEADLTETEARLDELNSRLEQFESEKVNREQVQLEISTRIEKQQKRMEKTLQRKALLISQAAECAKNIRELGVLPEEAFDKYENMQANTVSRSIISYLT
jgi:structural maintenance of chromosome 3 (chondroitin sulfate proteoglycan 6)